MIASSKSWKLPACCSGVAGGGGQKSKSLGWLDPSPPHSEIFFLADEEFDLFGDPVRFPSGRRGRPSHVATQKNRNKVMVLLALGWSNERIAGALHITQPTLRKYYFSELKARDIQRDRLDAWRFEKVIAAAQEGNVGGMRLLAQMIEKNDLVLADAKIRAAQKSSRKTGYVGKKELEHMAAHEAAKGGDDDWGDDLKPGVKPC